MLLTINVGNTNSVLGVFRGEDLIANWRLVKIGTTQAQRKLFFNLKREKDKLEREGFRPEPKLLAEKLDVKESEVRKDPLSVLVPLSKDRLNGFPNEKIFVGATIQGLSINCESAVEGLECSCQIKSRMRDCGNKHSPE